MEGVSDPRFRCFAISSQPRAGRTDTFRMKPLTARTNDESLPVPEDSLRARRIGLVADDSLWDGGALSKGAISTDALLHIHVHSADLPPAAEQRMIDAIARPPAVGESRAEANIRREKELLEIFGELTPAQA